MAQIKTIDTVAGENQIDFKRRYPFVWLKNLGDTDVYISDKAGIVAEADGVVLLGAGQAAMLENYDDCVYVLGATTIEAHGQHSADSPFGDTIVAGGGGGGGGSAVIQSLSATENKTYNVPTGVDGFNPVVVNVPAPVLIEKTITQNGVYDPEDDNADGYSMIDVDVPAVEVIELNANMNRTYTAPAGKAYSPVNVSVPGTSISKLTVGHNNVTYEAGIGAAFDPVEVSIPMDTLNAPSNGVYEIDTTTQDGWDTVLVDVYEKYHELYTGGANMNPQRCYFNNDVNTNNYDEIWLDGQYMNTESSNNNMHIWNGRYPTSVLSSIYANNGFIGSIGSHNDMWWRPDSTGKFMTNVHYSYDFPYAFFGVKNKDRTEECLWENTGSTTPSTVTLSESIFDYDEICLYFVKSDGATQTSWYLTDELSVGDIVQGYDDTQYPATLNKYTIASNTTLTVLSESGGYVLMGVYGVNDTSLSETTLYTNPDPTTAPATVTLSDSYDNYDEIVLIGHVPSEDTVCSYYYPVKILGRWTHDAYRDRIGVFSNQKSCWLTFTSNTTLVAEANPAIILDKIIGIKRPVVSTAHELIDVEPLSVTTNGTYTAPSGTAYSPVIVDIHDYGDVLFCNYSINSNNATLSKAYTNYKEIVLVVAFGGNVIVTQKIPTSQIAIENNIGVCTDIDYLWLRVASTTSFTQTIASYNNVRLVKIIGMGEISND